MWKSKGERGGREGRDMKEGRRRGRDGEEGHKGGRGGWEERDGEGERRVGGTERRK